MSLWQLAKLPRAAPVHADARLPMAVIVGDALRFSGGHPAAASCSQWLPLGSCPILASLLGQDCLLPLGSSQLPAGDGAERGSGEAQPPGQLFPQTAAITSCLHPD